MHRRRRRSLRSCSRSRCSRPPRRASRSARAAAAAASSSRCPRFRRRRISPATPSSSRRSRSSSATSETVEEVRVNGKLKWIKVTPRHGRPYFLVPDAGGQTFIRRDSLDSGLKVPMWLLFSGSELIRPFAGSPPRAGAPFARRDARCPSTRPSPPRNSTPGSRATRSAGSSRNAPIASGIENTNYFVTTTKGRYVLTLYERLPAERAAVLPQPDGASRARRRRVPGAGARSHRRAVLAAERQAREPRRRASTARRSQRPDAAHCAAVGDALGAPARRVGDLSRAAHQPARTGVVAAGGARRAALSHAAQNALLDAEIKFQTGFGKVKLPKGAIHGDLFCDNVLFDGDRVAGIIDFGFAATDFFAYDLAITVNDWCVDEPDGALDARARRARSSARTTRAAADGGRARAMAGAAARRRAALLAVAALRPASAASRRAHARARSGAFRAHPARSRRDRVPLPGAIRAPP